MNKPYTLLFTKAWTILLIANKITISKLSRTKENNPYLKVLALFNVSREYIWWRCTVTNIGDTARVFLEYHEAVNFGSYGLLKYTLLSNTGQRFC